MAMARRVFRAVPTNEKDCPESDTEPAPTCPWGGGGAFPPEGYNQKKKRTILKDPCHCVPAAAYLGAPELETSPAVRTWLSSAV